MAEESFPFDEGPGASSYEDRWRRMMRSAVGSGVVPGSGTSALNTLRITSAASTANFSAGAAFVDGIYYYNSTTLGKPLTVNSASTPRRCTAVLRLDVASNTIVADVVYGAPAASPVPPVLTQNATGIWEFPLADFTLTPGSATPSSIYDRRSFLAPRRKLEVGNATYGANYDGVSEIIEKNFQTTVTTDDAGFFSIALNPAFPNGIFYANVVNAQNGFAGYCIVQSDGTYTNQVFGRAIFGASHQPRLTLRINVHAVGW